MLCTVSDRLLKRYFERYYAVSCIRAVFICEWDTPSLPGKKPSNHGSFSSFYDLPRTICVVFTSKITKKFYRFKLIESDVDIDIKNVKWRD